MNDNIEDIVDNLTRTEKPIIKNEEVKIENIDTIQEQIEAPDTSIFCPESIKEKELRLIHKKPQDYIEINIVKKIRIVDTFYISSKIRVFHYKDIVYNIDEEQVYLLPTKTGFFMPTSFYYEKKGIPISFKQTNKGITGKALSLLYDENLYTDLFSGDVSKYNLVIVILSIISIACFLIGLYLLFKGGI